MIVICRHCSVHSLMENIRVKRAGYAFRQAYAPFLYRYKMLAPATWPQWQGEAIDGVREILTHQHIPDDEIAFGKSKLFIRNPRTVSGSSNDFIFIKFLKKNE